MTEETDLTVDRYRASISSVDWRELLLVKHTPVAGIEYGYSSTMLTVRDRTTLRESVIELRGVTVGWYGSRVLNNSFGMPFLALRFEYGGGGRALIGIDESVSVDHEGNSELTQTNTIVALGGGRALLTLAAGSFSLSFGTDLDAGLAVRAEMTRALLTGLEVRERRAAFLLGSEVVGRVGWHPSERVSVYLGHRASYLALAAPDLVAGTERPRERSITLAVALGSAR